MNRIVIVVLVVYVGLIALIGYGLSISGVDYEWR